MFNLQFKKIFSFCLDLIFPKQCLNCQKEGTYLCKNCLKEIEIKKQLNCYICNDRSPSGKICQKCKTKFHPALTGLLVVSEWNNPLLKQIIYSYKYNFITDLAQSLGLLIKSFLNFHNTTIKLDDTIILSIPLHKRRQAWRGFNQAWLLTKEINQYFNIPIYSGILEKYRSTLPQADIDNKNERIKNVADVFKIKNSINMELLKKEFKDKIIILVDDICTTGSTLQNCAKVLKPLKPKEIWGLVIARG